MEVKALRSFTGANGRVDRGDKINVPPHYAAALLKNGLIEIVDGSDPSKCLPPAMFDPQRMRPEWFPRWKRESAIIVASGPSATGTAEILEQIAGPVFVTP